MSLPIIDEYTTVNGVSRSESYVKKSKFIGLATSVNTEKEALEFIRAVRSEYADATHCCYAFSIGLGSKRVFRSNDAGEPINSAGKPILTVIESSGFQNVICAVVRYFGGIKLGIGGIIRAYSQTAKDCLKNAKPVVCITSTDLQVDVPYIHIGAVVNLVARLKGKISSMNHGEKAHAVVHIRCSLVSSFKEQIKAISNNILVR